MVYWVVNSVIYKIQSITLFVCTLIFCDEIIGLSNLQKIELFAPF